MTGRQSRLILPSEDAERELDDDVASAPAPDAPPPVVAPLRVGASEAALASMVAVIEQRYQHGGYGDTLVLREGSTAGGVIAELDVTISAIAGGLSARAADRMLLTRLVTIINGRAEE